MSSNDFKGVNIGVGMNAAFLSFEENCYEISNSGLLEVNQECNFYSITELKNRYKSIKQSIGIELKLYGFSFYSYPTAITYEYQIPISDPWNKKGQQYLKVLFDFK